MKHIVLATTLLIASFSGAVQAQTYPDLGQALYARGYSGTVWVNSFDTSQSRLAHGVFYPAIPIGIAGYDLRYGMSITGSGTVSVGTDGFYMATGTATNPNAIPSDGSVSIDLLSNGNIIDGAKIAFNCGASATCSWTTHFQTRPTFPNLSVRVYRHVEGSNCGGELSIDLNGTCKATLISTLHLPAAYTFTDTDNLDTNYAAKPGATTSALCDIIKPICAGSPPPPPPVPASNFSWSPSEVYPGTAVTFTDQSSNGPTGWSWSFQNGAPASSAIANPVVTFSSAGSKAVTLTASNIQGVGNLAAKTVTVLDPNPAGSVSASAASLTQCQVETFTANVTGAPPLTYSWRVLDPSGATVNPPGVVSGGTTFAWTSPPSLAPGTYTGQVTVKNSANPTGLVLSKAVQLTALPALTDISNSPPTTNAFSSNVVQFTAPAFTGATQVVWDYGDGKSDTFTDPVAGKTPSHTYAAIGTYNAKVTISNCANPAGFTSAAVSVQITQTTQLIVGFQVVCPFGICGFSTGAPVTFTDTSEGADFWDYDWTHSGTDQQTCNFTDNGHTSPVLSHTYATAGSFNPCLQVRRGSENKVAVLSFTLVVSSSGPQPSIAVFGPGTGLTNQALTFSASSSNCTPAAAGWTWSVTGGNISGSTTGSTISVSWTSIGTKTVSATNSACSGAQGSAGVSISADTGGQTVAQFTFTPAAPKAGDTVTFDSSASSNVPSGASIGWSFGDSSAPTSGSRATHVYTSAGNYSVQLSISPAGCLNTSCQSTVTKTVTVAPGTTATLLAQFTFSPAAPKTGDTVSFDSSSSTGVPAGASIGWSFGDGGTASGASTTHAYANAGSFTVQLTITPSGCVNTSCLSTAAKLVTVAPVVTGGPQFTVSPGSPTSGDAATFDATASTNVPAGSLFGWSFGDNSATGFGTVVSHTFAAAGTYNVVLAITPPGCTAQSCLALAAKTVVVTPGNGVHFSVSPASPSATQAATLDATASTNVPAGSLFGWSFGDGSATGFGQVVSHIFAAQGTYNVVLAITPPGCTAQSCLALAAKTVVVGPAPPVSADFSSPDGACSSDPCQAQATTAVTLTAVAADATTYAWDFGDGTNGAGRQVTHAWAQPGTYVVSLTAVKGAAAATKTRSFVVGPAPAPKVKTTLMPLATQSRGVLVQSNDLYVYNPGSTPLEVTLEFRKRGTPDVNPPRSVSTLQPGATLFAPDMLRSLFNVENVTGFITVLSGLDSVQPVITSFNSQGATASKLFGLTIPGSAVNGVPSSGSAGSQFLVGLHDSPDRQSSFGFSNPTDTTATYHLRFFDKTGRLLTESSDLTLSGHDQRQFTVQEIRDSFGINNLDDYRVEVKNVSGAQVFPFGSDLRVVTGDPSFTQAGTYTMPRLYLLGVFTGAGAAKSTWQTDLLLSNVSDQPLQTTLAFTAVSTKAAVKATQVTVQPGTTERLENALFSQFGLRNGTGVLTLTSTSPNNIFPIARAESYDNTNPSKRYGQSLIALSDADAADTTKREVLVGLRQDGANKTTLWLLNPSGSAGLYDLVYRGLNGAVLGTLAGVKIGAGQLHQIAPSQHPLKRTGVPGGFTVEVVVKSGKALAAAQVVRAGSNDPVFVAAQVR